MDRQEVGFWRRWLTGERGMDRHYSRPERLEPQLELQVEFLRRLEPGLDRYNLIDVGSGPLCCFGNMLPFQDATLNAVGIDPLASEYAALLSELGLSRGRWPVVTRLSGPGALWGLPREGADLIYCRNALDHMPDPLAALSEMISALLPHGVLLIDSMTNEADRQNDAVHHWNLGRYGEDVILSSPKVASVGLTSLHGWAEQNHARLITEDMEAIDPPGSVVGWFRFELRRA